MKQTCTLLTALLILSLNLLANENNTHSTTDLTLTCNSDSWFKYPDNGKTFEKGTNVYVKVNAEDHGDIEYMKLYLNGHQIRKEYNAPYEWGKPGGSDDELKNMQPGEYKLKVKIKDECGDYRYEECKFYVEDDCNYECEYDAWFEKPICGNKYPKGSNIYVKVKAKKHQHIEWMKLYVNGHQVRKESSAPYEWGKSGSSDNELKNMQPGEYKLRVKIKDKCGDYHIIKCKIYIEEECDEPQHCEWDAWFDKPNCGGDYYKGDNIYVKVKAKKHQHIEWMKLYVNGHEVRKESNAPYEWGKSGSSDSELKNMQPGEYKLKVKIKDVCGDYHYIECNIYVKDECDEPDHCEWDSWFEHPNCNNTYDEHCNIYVKVKAKKHQHIEWMKLYVNGHEVRKENNAPYEWGKSGSSDSELKNLEEGEYRLKVKIKDICGDYHYKECKIYVED